MFAAILFAVEDWVTFWLLMWATTVYLDKLDLLRQLGGLNAKNAIRKTEAHVVASHMPCCRSDSSSYCSSDELLTDYSSNSSMVSSEAEEEAASWGTAISPLQLLDITIDDRNMYLEVQKGKVYATEDLPLPYILDTFGKKAINSVQVPHDAACGDICAYTVKAVWDCHSKTRYEFSLVSHYKAADKCPKPLSTPANINALCNAARDLW